MTSVVESLSGWQEGDLKNLASLLEIKGAVSADSLACGLKWLFHSKVGAEAEAASKNTWAKLRKDGTRVTADSLRSTPSFEELLDGACQHLKAFEMNASTAEKEVFLSQAVIIEALQGMKPRERVTFFATLVDVDSIVGGVKLKGQSFSGPMTSMAMMGAAQASGFGVYLASTTALGFLTHAVGVTLPFAFYAGLSSSIAFVIGPAGWLSIAAWSSWKLMQPEWRKIVKGLIYIIARNSRGQSLCLPDPGLPR
ncbi:hypothetical protein PY254_01575 [Rhodanobacter sp. AS-Z3]|uniref:hypothetical protein n=1 Tax=Rhodanobacter sp. AS-Z3 TaxID=3031330 RepID=UPI002478E1C9|nr:hypothetical protein [Rhodanobacter sp. AS-Z3]WEN15398.1 hypothetical protein PY254_01575 [Rhodanobacter sp. AS-Z3]